MRTDGLVFPELAARDLEGRLRRLPDAFEGEQNLVVVAFLRRQQSDVDTWVAWFEGVRATRPMLACYEIPMLATRWSPVRRFIDGGMAQAVRESEARRRTLTVYTDVRQVTRALEIGTTRVVTALLVDAVGRVLWRATGPAAAGDTAALLEVIDGTPGDSNDRSART